MINIDDILNEYYQIKNWQKDYVNQCVQYAQDLRLKEKSDINIEELDEQAILKAQRLEELQSIIDEYFENNSLA